MKCWYAIFSQSFAQSCAQNLERRNGLERNSTETSTQTSQRYPDLPAKLPSTIHWAARRSFLQPKEALRSLDAQLPFSVFVTVPLGITAVLIVGCGLLESSPSQCRDHPYGCRVTPFRPIPLFGSCFIYTPVHMLQAFCVPPQALSF